MKNLPIYVASGIFALALSSAAGAQQPDLEVTMDVVPHSAAPGAVTREIKLPITLPDAASDRARDASAFGHETANRARGLKGDMSGREFGQETSQRARERPPLPKPSVPGKK